MADEIIVDVDAIIGSGQEFEVTILVKKPTTPADVELTLSVNGAARAFGLKIGGIELAPAKTQNITAGAAIDWIVFDWGTAASSSHVTMKAAELGGDKREGQDSGTVH